MNYFAHAYVHLDAPYFVAGTAVPDWLNVVDRRVRCRSRHAMPFCGDPCLEVAQLAQGIVRHHADDLAFHHSREFTELSLAFACDIRRFLNDDTPHRPGFLGHILVEILLDAELLQRDWDALETYYRRLAGVDPQRVAQIVSRMTGRPTESLAPWIGRFLEERFLFDYVDDAKLLVRLNQVMRRVRLPALEESLLQFLPDARRRVGQRADWLFAPVHGTSHHSNRRIAQ
jgi:hypothetical protein